MLHAKIFSYNICAKGKQIEGNAKIPRTFCYRLHFFWFFRCYAIAICIALLEFWGKVVGFYLCTMMHAHRELVELTGKSVYNEHIY